MTADTGDTLDIQWQPFGGSTAIKTLTRHVNSLALVIGRASLDLLRIDAETPLEISADGQVLIVSPVTDAEHRGKFETALMWALT